jgi:glutamate/tyrosine decarboxylase-like PLP-dependent enzyme
MNGRERLIATLVIWAGITIMMTTPSSILSQDAAAATFAIMAAAFATFAVWLSARWTGENKMSKQFEKGKRQNNRLNRLIDNLDDYELHDLEERLATRRESEQVELSQLLMSQPRNNRR